MTESHDLLLDPIGGLAGDMFIAAAVDLWPELEPEILWILTHAGLPAEHRVELTQCSKGGLAARRFSVTIPGEVTHGTSYQALQHRLAEANLPAGVLANAQGILELLARAEAVAHGVSLQDVHLHELGDWDSIADIIGAGVVIEHARGSRWHYRDLPLGRGIVRTRHGDIPVPVPAVTTLLAGFKFADDGLPGERVTPTGAAILRYLQPRPAAGAAGRLLGAGCGAGQRDLPGKPNVLRLLAFGSPPADESVVVIRFDLDDQTGEDLAIALDRIRAATGVIDVCLWGGLGKKGRPLQCVQVLCEPVFQDDVMALCLNETATLGLRWSLTHRRVLERTVRSYPRATGPVRVKHARRPAGSVSSKVEAADVEASQLDYAGRERLRHQATDGGPDDD